MCVEEESRSGNPCGYAILPRDPQENDVLEAIAVVPLEIVVHRMLVPCDRANLAVDHLRQTRLNVIAQPANDEA